MKNILKYTLAACLTLGGALTMVPACVSAQSITIDANDTTVAGWWLRAAQDLDRIALNTANGGVGTLLPNLQTISINDLSGLASALTSAYLVQAPAVPSTDLTNAFLAFFQAGEAYLSNAPGSSLPGWYAAGAILAAQLQTTSTLATGTAPNAVVVGLTQNFITNFVNAAALILSDYQSNNANVPNDDSALVQLAYQIGIFTSISLFNL